MSYAINIRGLYLYSFHLPFVESCIITTFPDRDMDVIIFIALRGSPRGMVPPPLKIIKFDRIYQIKSTRIPFKQINPGLSLIFRCSIQSFTALKIKIHYFTIVMATDIPDSVVLFPVETIEVILLSFYWSIPFAPINIHITIVGNDRVHTQPYSDHQKICMA